MIDPNTIVGIPNFRIVAPGIYRGGQPDAAGWIFLVSQGVKTSIKLNYEAEGAPAGVNVVVCAMPPEGLLTSEERPSDEAIKLAVETLSLPISGTFDNGVYIHCDHGQDRTGLIVALHRVLNQGWSRKDAWHEMIDCGFHPIFLGLVEAWFTWTAGK